MKYHITGGGFIISITDKKLSDYSFIDLFAGIGGFRLALESLGAKCVYSSEWDKEASKVYELNFNDIPHGDITKIDANSIPYHDILCAGFPCQAFSVSGKQLGFNDSRGTLFFDVARIIKAKNPKVVFLENVKNFLTHDNGNTIRVVEDTIKKLGYTFHKKILNSSNYGIPQSRERIYIICFRNDLNITNFSYPCEIRLQKNIKDILLNDESIVKNLYMDNLKIKFTNKNKIYKKNKPIRIGSVNRGGQGERIYSISGCAITLSASGGGLFAKTGGYLINNKARKLHTRECARLMGYPDNFIISEKNNQAYKQLGNSVVVDVLQYIGIEIANALNNSL